MTPPALHPLFAPHLGNNNHPIDCHIRRGGHVSLKAHLGSPPDGPLWQDLVERLGVRRMRVYYPDAYEWTDGFGGGTAIVYLDQHGNVDDVHLSL